MTESSRVCIVRRREEGLQWEAVLRLLEEAFRWEATTEVFMYLEAVSRCELTKKVLSECEPPSDAIEGRLFLNPVEARWRRRPDGDYDVWLLREESADSLSNGGDMFEAERLDRKYYLVGLGHNEDPTVFTEARYLDKRFIYPVGAPGTAQPGLPAKSRRAFIKVAEYQAPKPDWESIADEVAIAEQLDQPLLCAHRFIDVDVDWGE